MQIIYVALALLLLTFGFQWPQTLDAAVYATAVLTTLSWLGYAGVGLKALLRRLRGV
jgi:hypothetical protein